jgi:hypothetical protein
VTQVSNFNKVLEGWMGGAEKVIPSPSGDYFQNLKKILETGKTLENAKPVLLTRPRASALWPTEEQEHLRSLLLLLFFKQYPVFICRANFHLW